MKDTPNLSASQAEDYADFTARQVAVLLNRSYSWVIKAQNRDLLGGYSVTGRGCTGQEVRFRRAAVLALVDKYRKANGTTRNDQHESVDEIINRVKRERTAAGQSC